jgi:glycosyltransferase involved in cell wall biosynthesis
LAEAIASVCQQTFADFEFIIVDDGSTDGSDKIIDAAAAADIRLRVIRRPNTGLVGALNDGLAAVRGTFIARMYGC